MRPTPPFVSSSSTKPAAPAASPRGVVTCLVDEGFTGPLARVASEDSFIPLGDAALEVLLSEDTIEAAAIKLTQVRR